MKAPIVEVFQSIQGEGKSLGQPAIFVRFFGCTLNCRFKSEHCDTPYAVNIDKNKCKMMTPKQLAKTIDNIGECFRVIFTGGEPTLYQKFIIETIKKLDMSEFYTYEIETNGTVPIIEEFANIIHQFNVSVKLKGSNQPTEELDKKRINDNALKTFPVNKSNFKFVVSNKKEMDEIFDLTCKYKFHPIYLMPQGMDIKTIRKNSLYVVDMCIENNFVFSPREHIIIWGGRKGV